MWWVLSAHMADDFSVVPPEHRVHQKVRSPDGLSDKHPVGDSFGQAWAAWNINAIISIYHPFWVSWLEVHHQWAGSSSLVTQNG